MKPLRIQIDQINGPKFAFLALEGTILIYETKDWVKESISQVPIELVSITERRRLHGNMVVMPLLVFLFSLLVAMAILVNGITPQGSYTAMFLLVMFSIGLAICLIVLRKYSLRSKTVMFMFAPTNDTIEF